MAAFDFTGSTVVVTGSSRGIGRRIGERFHEAGANVAFCSITGGGGEKLMEEIAGSERGRIMTGTLDASSIDSIFAFLDSVAQRWGRIDILVNNAGIFSLETLDEVTEESWEKMLDINLKSMLFASQWFARNFDESVERPHGASIVNIASVSSKTFIPANLLYNISKAGVVTLTKTLARELGPRGIRVNAVGPGSVPTDLNAAIYADKERERALCEKIPLGRRASKDDIASAVLFLASDEASYLTGQVIYAEGGWLLV